MVAADAGVLATLSRALHDQGDERAAASAALEQARVVVPDAEHACVTVRTGGRRTRVLAASDDLAHAHELLQQELHEGPSVDVVRDGAWLRSGDLRHDGRWPSFGPAAAARGIGSLLSVRLDARGRTFGALTMYSSGVGGFPDEIVELAVAWTVHVATALTAVDRLEGLETALATRHVIGVAVGLLMGRHGLSEERAFQLLCRVSSQLNTKVRDVAAEVVGTGGRLPGQRDD